MTVPALGRREQPDCFVFFFLSFVTYGKSKGPRREFRPVQGDFIRDVIRVGEEPARVTARRL